MSGALPSRAQAPGQNAPDKKKRTVAIVVSSISPPGSDEFASEHAVSLLYTLCLDLLVLY
jgi:hypothetical protein